MFQTTTTTHPTEGYNVQILYIVENWRVRIVRVFADGKDIFGHLSSSEIQVLKARIQASL